MVLIGDLFIFWSDWRILLWIFWSKFGVCWWSNFFIQFLCSTESFLNPGAGSYFGDSGIFEAIFFGNQGGISGILVWALWNLDIRSWIPLAVISSWFLHFLVLHFLDNLIQKFEGYCCLELNWFLAYLCLLLSQFLGSWSHISHLKKNRKKLGGTFFIDSGIIESFIPGSKGGLLASLSWIITFGFLACVGFWKRDLALRGALHHFSSLLNSWLHFFGLG